jgi:clan AA aspartic protease (TIGR02281 family)
MGRFLLIVFCATFMMALAGPPLATMAGSLIERRNAESRTVVLPAPAQPQVQQVQQLTGGAVELRRDADSHFRAPVTIGGHSMTMLVDSGASFVVLKESDARAAGVSPPDADYIHKAVTAGGEVPVARVILPVIRVGGIERRNVPAMVMRGDTLPQSLLGQSFLGQLGEVSIRNDRMLLR